MERSPAPAFVTATLEQGAVGVPLMKRDLLLRPGPRLIAQGTVSDSDVAPLAQIGNDVTARAHEFLFDTIELDPRVTLADVFRLLDRSLVLKQVFRRDWAEELCAEAREGLVDSPRDHAEQERIDYLELRQEWHLDTGSDTYLPMHRLQLHGVGVKLLEDASAYGRKKGERIEWALSLTPLCEILDLHLQASPEAVVKEDDLDSSSYGLELFRVRHDMTLGQVIDGVLSELSFHGGPKERAEFAMELKRRKDEIDDGTAVTRSAEEIFGDLGRLGIDALFDDLGGNSVYEIRTAMRRINDNENAAAWFAREFCGAVVVKAQFLNRTGRDFRKAFRAANR